VADVKLINHARCVVLQAGWLGGSSVFVNVPSGGQRCNFIDFHTGATEEVQVWQKNAIERKNGKK